MTSMLRRLAPFALACILLPACEGTVAITEVTGVHDAGEDPVEETTDAADARSEPPISEAAPDTDAAETNAPEADAPEADAADADADADAPFDSADAHTPACTGIRDFVAPTSQPAKNGLGDVIVADVNADGEPDIVALDGGSIGVWLNRGAGSFGLEAIWPTLPVGATALSLADLNGDGLLDASVANDWSGLISVFLNDGTGGFSERVDYDTDNFPSSITAGDFDGDGTTDLAVAHLVEKVVSVLLNNGDGSFAASQGFAVLEPARWLASGDFDGNGSLDLAVAGRVGVLLNHGDGTFGAQVAVTQYGNHSFVAVADLDGDGTADLVTDTHPKGISVLLNQGDGTFPTQASYGDSFDPASVAVGDLNSDGHPDLAVMEDSGDFSVLVNDGQGTFGMVSDYPFGDGPVSGAMADLDHDNVAELVITRNGDVTLLRNDGTGVLEVEPRYETSSIPVSVAVADFDGNGSPDIAALGQVGIGTASVLLNHGDGTFAPRIDHATGQSSQSIVAGDFNGDGKPDLATANAYDNLLGIRRVTAGCVIGPQRKSCFAYQLRCRSGGWRPIVIGAFGPMPTGSYQCHGPMNPESRGSRLLQGTATAEIAPLPAEKGDPLRAFRAPEESIANPKTVAVS